MDKGSICGMEVIHVGPATHGGMSSVICFLLKMNDLSKLIPTRSYGKKNVLRNLIVYVRALIEVIFLSKMHRYIFHIHTTKNGSLVRKIVISMILRVTNNLYIAHMHAGSLGWFNSNFFLFRRILFTYLSSAKYVVVLSDSWKDYYLYRFPKLNNIRVIPNPCDSLLLECPPMTQKKTIKLLYAGVLSPEKGVYDLVDAFFGVDANVNIELHIFGSGEAKKLRNHADRSTKGGVIFIHDWLPHKAYLSLIKEFDVFVLPSYAEGMPMCILEAMGHALPIIASDVGGNSTLVINGVNGFLIKPGDVASLTEKMQCISLDFILRTQMSANSWKLAKYFSPKDICEKWNDTYASVANSTSIKQRRLEASTY